MNDTAELMKQLKQIIAEQNTKQTQEIKTQLNEEISEVKHLITKETEKIALLNKEVKELKLKNEKLEKTSKKNNIIIFNSGYRGGNILNFTLALLNTHLEINITEDHINDVYTVGRQDDNKSIVVSFVSNLTKQKVLKNCIKLKDTNIGITEELSKEERNIRKVLVQHLKTAKASNKKAHIHKQTLYVEGKAYTFEDLNRQINKDDEIEREDIEERQVRRKEKASQRENIQEIETKKNRNDVPSIRSSSRNNKK